MHVIRLKTILQGLGLAAVAICAAVLVVVCSRPEAALPTVSKTTQDYRLILDAGHGGLDGGAVSANGLSEAAVNLNITLKTQQLLRFCGVNGALTRTDENSLDYSPEATIKQNKVNDIKARYQIAQNMPGCDFLSIHLNKFEQEKYYGAQVFYSGNCDNSQVLAESLQESLKDVLDKNNDRRAKLAPNSVYLMKHITSPAVTIECGFLSNAREEQLLQQEEYQTKIALAITEGYLNYLS